MKVITHKPPPRECTYDLVGLTEDDMALLDALIGAVNGVGDAPEGQELWSKIREARNHDGHVSRRFEVRETGGVRPVVLSVWRVKP